MIIERIPEFISNHPYITAALLANITMIAVFEWQRRGGGSRELSPLEATIRQNNEDAVLIDLRDLGEYNTGHITNAKHIPLKDIPQRSDELLRLKDKPIILYCAVGASAPKAGRQLRKMGLDKLFHLAGGIAGWEKASMPVTKK